MKAEAILHLHQQPPGRQQLWKKKMRPSLNQRAGDILTTVHTANEVWRLSTAVN